MEVNFNVTGKDRKNMVAAISEITGAEATYKGVPTFAYEVDYFTIDRFGTVSFGERVDIVFINQTVYNILSVNLEVLYDYGRND